MATVLIYLLLSILHLQHLVNVASIGASAFIVFAMPKSLTSKEKNLVAVMLAASLWELCWQFFWPTAKLQRFGL
jgi:CBS-domain-containing membrane protein